MARFSTTDSMKRLVEQSGENSSGGNPALKRGNPILKPPEEEAQAPVFVKSIGGFQLVNVPFLLINEQLGGIMERFNCCMCERCVAAVTEEVLAAVTPKILEVRRKSDEKIVNKAAAEQRSEIVKAITKAVIAIKTNPPHSMPVDKTTHL